ncbi:chromatin-remodeling ATPase INO80-like [Leptopilina heterotoma]|uniref:chromatin-remodeling ATPase INO80-like n=1 Tax=Leptopilina heterotoma TaxID=63436 RepID=UPI001CA96324|nr:chromatin-remodeling ATPase INO80-like [Leptopilina heterotoma]
MSGRFKKFEELSSRQKRRRLNNILENIIHIEEDSDRLEWDPENIVNESGDNDGNSFSGERENENIDADTGDNDNFIGNHNKSDNDISDAESESSHEDDFDENLENVEDPAEMDSDSDVLENEEEADLVYLQRKALKNAYLTANINLSQENILLKTLREFPFNQISLPKDARTVVNTPTIVTI